MRYKSLPISFILLFITFSLSAQNDSLLLNNGNLLVGEIKTLQKGVITMETDYSDSDFKIEWNKVRQIYGEHAFIISLSDGTRLIGTLRSNPEDSSKVIIYEKGKVFPANIIDVVTMKAFKGNFVGRLSASLDLGLTLTKANNLRQFSARSNLGYQGRAWAADASFDAVRSLQDSIAATRRTDASIGGRVLFQKMWFYFLSVKFLQNDEQKLKLRSTTTSGIGHYFVTSNRVYFAGATGLAWNNELFTDGQPMQNSLEGFAGLELNLFDIEDFSLLTNISVYPGISQKGRLRADFKIDLKYDLPLDFYIKFGYTHNFDNQPATNGSKNDYVFQTTVGWEL